MIVTSLLGAALLILASPLQLHSATNFFNRNQHFFSPVPDRPPLSIRYSLPSSTSILLYWDPVPPQFENGIIRGFNVGYQENKPNSELAIRERFLVNWVLLDGLKKFTEYSVRVSAFTSIGYGPENNITVLTPQDGTTLRGSVFLFSYT